jgi:hypothetical protein
VTLPRETINAIMTTVARTHDWGSRWAYDGKKSLYSIDPKLPFPEVGFVAEIEEEGRRLQFRVQVRCPVHPSRQELSQCECTHTLSNSSRCLGDSTPEGR